MRYTTVEKDFVRRTLEILDQYDRLVRSSVPLGEQYEVTLLLNCLLGLVILPFESQKRVQGNPRFPKICERDDTIISELSPEWGLDQIVIEHFQLDGRQVTEADTTLRQVVAMFRHGLAHSQFGDGSRRRAPQGLSVRYQTVEHNPIESVILQVNLVNQHRETRFEASMPVGALRRFAVALATAYLKELDDTRRGVDD